MYCWASQLGGCSTASREHLISEGMWDAVAIHVVGFEWCKTTPMKVGQASLTAKILCRKHNSDLSLVDQGGIDAFHAIKDQAAEINDRLLTVDAPWEVRRKAVSGVLLERWLLKTLINISLRGASTPTWPGHSATVPLTLVEAAFGIRELEKPLGLYLLAKRGDRIDLQDRIEVTTLLSDDGVLVGAEFSFAGLTLVLAIDPAMPERMHAEGVSVLYRFSKMTQNVLSRLSHELALRW